MRKGKKAVLSVMIFAMAFGLTACGKSKEEYFAERMEEMGGSLNVSEDDENAQQIKDLMDGLAEDFANQKVEEKKKKEVSFGTWEGKVYTNKYVGLTAEFGPDWTISSAEELQAITDETETILKDSDIGGYLRQLDFVRDMMVENVDDFTTVNITYTKMTKQEQEQYAKKTEKEIVQATASSVELVADAYKQMGMTVKSTSVKEVYFLGERRTAHHMCLDYFGTPYYVLQFYDYHSGEYATLLTVASFHNDKTMELLNLFTKCE